MEEFHLKQDEISRGSIKSRTAVTNTIRLLKLDERVQDMLIQDMISPGHAKHFWESKTKTSNIIWRCESLMKTECQRYRKNRERSAESQKKKKEKEADPQME